MHYYNQNNQNEISSTSIYTRYTKEQLQINYHNNMKFFQQYNANIFQALQKSPILYNLHIDSYGHNIIHLPSQKLQYPLIQDARQAKSISAMLDSHAELAKNPMQNPKWHIQCNFPTCMQAVFFDEDIFPVTGKYGNKILKTSLDNIQNLVIKSNSNNANSQHIRNDMSKEDLAKRIDELACNNIKKSFSDSKFLPQTIIYGLMGGLFLHDLLLQGLFFHSLIIYEEHIDLFRISLYFLEYELLFSRVGENSCLIFVKDFSTPIISTFLHSKRITNNSIKLELKQYTSNNIQNLQDIINKEKKIALRGWGTFEDEKIGFNNALENLKSCKILSNKTKKVNAPICVVGNGASLDLCLDFIKAYQDRMIIFSCGTALKVLRHHNIKPDFQIEIERISYLSDVLKEANLEDIPLIFGQMTDCKAVNLASESFAFMRAGSASAYLDSRAFVLDFGAPFVGNAGTALAALIGSDVILCGIDCGYIKGYSKHAKNSFYGNETSEIPNDCFKVESNKNLEVYSNDLFYLSIKNIESSIKLYKPNIAINIGYGAKISGTLSLNEDDFFLKKIDKQKAIKELKNNFLPFVLSLNKHEVLKPINTLAKQIHIFLDKEVQNTSDLYVIIDNIESLLQNLIAKQDMRKGVVLVEGSILHLCFCMLQASLFAGNMQSYHIMKLLFKQWIYDVITCIIQDIDISKI